MVKQIVFLVLSAMTMEACSTEQNTIEQVRMLMQKVSLISK